MTDRIETLEGVSALEVMAPSLTIAWDPVTNSGPITFRTARYLVQDGTIRADVTPSPSGSFSVPMEGLMLRCFVPAVEGDATTDPVTGADLTQISVAGIMMLIKAAFATLYTEQLQTSLTPPPEPDPPPEE